MSKLWTDADTQTLAKMWGEGKSGKQIADATGYTRSAVLGKVSRMGLSPRGCPPQFKIKKQREERREFGLAKIAEIKDIEQVGYTFEQIAGNFRKCHAPVGKVFWCGEPVVADTVYCKKHCAIIYRPTPGKKVFDDAA